MKLYRKRKIDAIGREQTPPNITPDGVWQYAHDPQATRDAGLGAKVREAPRAEEPFDADWLGWFYARVTDQFDLSRKSLHDTHQWVITLSIGLVTAVLVLPSQSSPYPNEFGLVAVLASFPLLFRFFVRSCLECSIQYKWMEIRNALDRYFYLQDAPPEIRSAASRHLRETIELFYFDWKSPKSLWAIVRENLQLAYGWPFLIAIFGIAWGARTLSMSPLLGFVAWAVVLFMIYEIIAFVKYSGFNRAELLLERGKELIQEAQQEGEG